MAARPAAPKEVGIGDGDAFHAGGERVIDQFAVLIEIARANVEDFNKGSSGVRSGSAPGMTPTIGETRASGTCAFSILVIAGEPTGISAARVSVAPSWLNRATDLSGL